MTDQNLKDDDSKEGRDPKKNREAAALKALPSAGREMTAEEDPDALLRKICALSIDILNASTASLLIWDEARNHLIFKVTGSDVCDQLEGKSMPSSEGIAGWVFTHRQALIIPNVRKDERFYDAIDESLGRQTTSLIAAPLMTENEMLGVIEVLDKQTGEGFDELDMDILTALASQASIAIDNIRMADKLKQQRQQLITIEQEIHKKLARDLHDGPAQWLAGISMNLEYILRLMDIDFSQAKMEVETTRRKLDHTINQVRNLMFELRPVLLESHDLRTALTHYIDNLNQMDGMNITLHMKDVDAALTPRTERAIFDIIREALSNIKRHAYTSEAWIDFSMDGAKALTITIRDNGLGFDLRSVQRDYTMRGSLGMLNMIERAELIGGNLTLKSIPNQGTTVTLTIPLSEDGAA